MYTTLRYGSDSKTVKLHAKEKFPIASQVFLQGHAELDTGVGAASHLAILIRQIYPQAFASTAMGIRYDENMKLSYNIQGKKAFPISSGGLVDFSIKGRCDVGTDFKERKTQLAAELNYSILNFQKEQDVRIKVGYEVVEKVPFVQLRENCWTLNFDARGKWNIRYYL